MARASFRAKVAAITVCLAALLCAAHVQATYVVIPATLSSAALNTECAIGADGLNLGSSGRIFVNCSDLVGSGTFDTCVSVLGNVTATQADTFPGALVTVDLSSTSVGAGYTALEVGRLLSMNQTSQIGLLFTGLSAGGIDNIPRIAYFIASARAYMTADSAAPRFIVWIEGTTNPCAGTGALVPATGGATLSTAIANALSGIGTLGANNGVTAQIGFSGITAGTAGADLCGFPAANVAFGQGDAVSTTTFAGTCSGISNPADVYGPFEFEIPSAGAAAPTGLFAGTARTGQAFGMSTKVPLVELPAANVTTYAGCLAAPGFTPVNASNGTLLFRGALCRSDLSEENAAQCRSVLDTTIGVNDLPVIAAFRFDIADSASVPLVQQVALVGRTVANMSIGAMNLQIDNAGSNATENLGALNRIFNYLAYIHRPAAANTTVNVVVRLPPTSCMSGGAFEETMIGGVMTTPGSLCAAQGEFSCSYSSSPFAYPPTGATCGFDAATAAAGQYRYSGPLREMFNTPECIAATDAANVLVGYASADSVPAVGLFSVGPTMAVLGVQEVTAESIGCATGADGASAGYVSLVCGAAASSDAVTACTTAIGTAVSADANVSVLVQVTVAAGAAVEDVTSAVQTLVGTSGVVGIQYSFAFGTGATNATANIARIVDVLNASVARVGVDANSTLTQVVVLADAVPCTESDSPAAGYLFAADDNATLSTLLSAIERTSVSLTVSGAVNFPSSGARCGFGGARINFGLPVLPEYTDTCNTVLAADGSGLLSVDPQTFNPVSVEPSGGGGGGGGGGGDGVGALVHAGVWSFGAVLLVLLSLAA